MSAVATTTTSTGSEAWIESSSTAAKPPIVIPGPSLDSTARTRLRPGRIYDPEQHADDEDAEEPGAPIRTLSVGIRAPQGLTALPTTTTTTTTATPSGKPAAAAGVRDIREPPLAEVGEDETVLDAAGAAEDVGVVGAGVALAEDVGGAELELGRQGGDARPLDVLGGVGAARVRAAHHVDGV